MAPKSSQPNLQFVHRVTMYMYGIRLLLSLALLSENIVVRILFCIVSSFSHDFSLFYISFFFFFLYIFVKLRKVGQATRFAPYLVISRYKMLRRWILLKEKRRKKKKRKKTRAFPFLFFFSIGTERDSRFVCESASGCIEADISLGDDFVSLTLSRQEQETKDL